ncbi:MAG: universal stress protein [Pseudomonadota bacterium]
MQSKNILLASHDTAGARAAEQLAFDLCEPGGAVHHLYVVPDFWKGMLGDDWLNNAVTRDRFGKYVETQLANEVEQARERVEADAERRGLRPHFEVRVGRPVDCLLEVTRLRSPDVVVIGSPRPKGAPGFRSRMHLETLVRGLSVPLIMAPHPGL